MSPARADSVVLLVVIVVGEPLMAIVNCSPAPVVPPDVLETLGQDFFQRALPTSTHVPAVFL
mgnify:CR=1 FL=1